MLEVDPRPVAPYWVGRKIDLVGSGAALAPAPGTPGARKRLRFYHYPMHLAPLSTLHVGTSGPLVRLGALVLGKAHLVYLSLYNYENGSCAPLLHRCGKEIEAEVHLQLQHPGVGISMHAASPRLVRPHARMNEPKRWPG